MAKRRATWNDIPFAAEAKYCKAVAQATLHGLKIPVYRTVDGKVVTYELSYIQLDFGNGKMFVVYYTSEFGDLVTEPASEQDLKLISLYAQQQIQRSK